MEIRVRTAEDLDELVEVAVRVHAVDNYPLMVPGGDFGRFLTRPEAVAAWVAVAGGRVVGHVAFNDLTSKSVMDLVASRFTGVPVYVSRLLVDPDARRRGIGHRLLAHAAKSARGVDRWPFLDVVDTPASAGARALYAKCGWVEVGSVCVEVGGGSVDAVVLSAPPA